MITDLGTLVVQVPGYSDSDAGQDALLAVLTGIVVIFIYEVFIK